MRIVKIAAAVLGYGKGREPWIEGVMRQQIGKEPPGRFRVDEGREL